MLGSIHTQQTLPEMYRTVRLKQATNTDPSCSLRQQSEIK